MADVDAIQVRWAKATPGPWWLCKHLRSTEDDASCPCGYRGGIWGADQEAVVCEMGAHDPDGMTGRYSRPQELANAQAIANAPNDIAWLLSAMSAARTRASHAETALEDARQQLRGLWDEWDATGEAECQPRVRQAIEGVTAKHGADYACDIFGDWLRAATTPAPTVRPPT